MTDQGIHVPPGGYKPPKPTTATAIAAAGKAKDSYARTLFVGWVLIILCVVYGVALVLKLDAANAVLGVVGTGIGFMLGHGRGHGGSQ